MAWTFGAIHVELVLGPHNDEDLDIVIKSKNIPLGIDPGGMSGPGGTVGGFGITIEEASAADNVRFWPSITIQDQGRRKTIFDTAKGLLESAEESNLRTIGFYTMGLEVSRVPSWEVAEEIVKAILVHSKSNTMIDTITLVASSPTQLSSFQYSLNNIPVILPE